MKIRTLYRCSTCGHSTPKWVGKCPGCGAWESMVEEVEQSASKKKSQNVSASQTQFLNA
ncbi:MAG: DNA repair protein RadA, partial [bacterium]